MGVENVSIAGRAQRPLDADQALVGREQECARLEELIRALRAGESRVLIVRGQPGVGKSALLKHAERAATGVRVLHAVGVESEMSLDFATVHQLCSPLLDGLPHLPDPMRAALETVIGLREGPVPDRFLIGLAVLNLMTHASEHGPLLCVIENAHWLDQPSVQVLAFVARRLLAESIALLFATRHVGPDLLALPEMEVVGLAPPAAGALLDSVTPAGLDRDIRDRIIAESQGNPRALREVPRGLTVTQVAGGLGLADSTLPPGPTEENLVHQIQELSRPAQRLLLVAAAEPSGNPDLFYRALHRLGFPVPAALTDEVEALLTVDVRVTFRHPLARSAAYRAAAAHDRRLVHQALGEVSDPRTNPDRRAWHLAAAAHAPDEALAAELEQTGERARARGHLAAGAALLQRSVALTEDASQRTNRAISAADASLRLGDFKATRTHLDTAERGARDSRQQGRIQLIRGKLGFASGRAHDAATLLLQATQRLQDVDQELAREAYLKAWGAAAAAADNDSLTAVSRAVAALPPQVGRRQPVQDLLRGFALLVIGDRGEAVPLLEHTVPAMANISASDVVQWGWIAADLGATIWDDQLMRSMLSWQVHVCRDAGALPDLAMHLTAFALTTAWTGDLAGAALLVADADRVTAATGGKVARVGALWLAALRGNEEDALPLIDSTIEEARTGGQGRGLAVAYWSASALFNSLGRYERAAVAARTAAELPGPGAPVWALAELVEAAIRISDDELARRALGRLIEATKASDTDWAAGITTRCRALVSDSADADVLFGEAIERLRRTSWRPELARAHLLYGERLRRQGRRVDARDQLRRAHDLFINIGMQAFAERTRRELQSTGESLRRRAADDPSVRELTPQEQEIALLVRDGYSNPEVGERLFLSPRTVEWHLRKIFAKLSISSRRQLRDALPRVEAQAAHRQ